MLLSIFRGDRAFIVVVDIILVHTSVVGRISLLLLFGHKQGIVGFVMGFQMLPQRRGGTRYAHFDGPSTQIATRVSGRIRLDIDGMLLVVNVIKTPQWTGFVALHVRTLESVAG